MSSQVVGERYEIIRKLGEGGMGAVYEARHTATGGRVALKVIADPALIKNKDMVARFEREVRAAATIESDHIVRVYDAGTDAATGQPFMAMEYLEGEDVQHLIAKLGTVQPDLALKIAAQAALGLARAHAAGVVHRDIKSANIFLARRDDAIVVKLLDFGIARVKMESFQDASHAALTRTGSMLGSPLYMSPEQAQGLKTIDHRTDIWSLGIVLYEMLTGRTPCHDIQSLGLLVLSLCSSEGPDIRKHAPAIDENIARLVDRCVAPDPNARFASAEELIDALKARMGNDIALRKELLRGMPESGAPSTEAGGAEIALAPTVRASSRPFSLESDTQSPLASSQVTASSPRTRGFAIGAAVLAIPVLLIVGGLTMRSRSVENTPIQPASVAVPPSSLSDDRPTSDAASSSAQPELVAAPPASSGAPAPPVAAVSTSTSDSTPGRTSGVPPKRHETASAPPSKPPPAPPRTAPPSTGLDETFR